MGEQDGLRSVGWENTALREPLHQVRCSTTLRSSSDEGTNPSGRDKQAGAVYATFSHSTLQGWVLPLEGSCPWYCLLLPQEEGKVSGHTQGPRGMSNSFCIFSIFFLYLQA